MAVIALVPARSGSKSIPGKNFRLLGDKPLFAHAIDCAYAAGCDPVALSTDNPHPATPYAPCLEIERPAELAQDDTPMIDVVRHALAQIPGQPDDVIVLLQPTQPFRTPARVREAITLLQSTGADSVVSVVPLPLTHHADAQLAIGSILGPDRLFGVGEYPEFPDSCLNRQQREQTYIRDGTVYAFKRDTVARYGHIYGDYCKPLILEPHETCELDTEADWAAVQARWEREHA
jgi:CMP-N,N'-diacetyllegionaminic acid synthase